MKTRTAYKLFRQRRDGSLGSLFIDRAARRPVDRWLMACSVPTEGYALRPGWHVTEKPEAPHLKTEGRVWRKVLIGDYQTFKRPKAQGGVWFIARWIKILP